MSSKNYSLFLIFFTLWNIAFAQEEKILSKAAYAEKIYLQFDRENYPAGSTIWFKSLVLNSVDHKPSQRSGVLHVDLIGPEKQLINQKLVKIVDGSGHNHFDIPKKMPPGIYKIRAYTRWNRNFGEDFIFSKYFRIFPKIPKTEKAIEHINIVDKKEGAFLEATFNPNKLDSLQKRKILVGLYLNNSEQDSLEIKANNGVYKLSYKLNEKTDYISINMLTENGFTASRSISLDENKVDLQLLPESGSLLDGTVNLLGIKALDFKGDGLYTEGLILNKNKDTITTFKTNKFGMGVAVIRPEATEEYIAKITNIDNETEYPLPEVLKNGNILSVRRTGERVSLIASTTNKSDSLMIRISFRGIKLFDIKGPVKAGHFNTALPVHVFPYGILCFTLLNENYQPVAERLYFNDVGKKQVTIAVKTNKNEYSSREKTSLSIHVKDSTGKNIAAQISVLALAKEPLGAEQQKGNSILPYFYLTSELRGKVEHPGLYFNRDDISRLRDIDALLLTQGWRKYKYDTTRIVFDYPEEPVLAIDGKVSGNIFNKPKEDVELSFIALGEQPVVQTYNTDSLGRFYFNVDFLNEENREIVIQSKKGGNKRNFDIAINDPESLPIIFENRQKIEKPDSTFSEIVNYEQRLQQKQLSYELAEGVTQLDEVVLEAYNMTEERKKTADLAGKPDIVIDGKDIQEKEKNWSYGLYSILLFNFPNDIRIQRDIEKPGGALQAKVIGGAGTTILMMDGMVINNLNYPLVPNIPPSEVKSVEVIRFAKHFSRLYMQAYPFASPMEVPPTGDVIAIYTHGKKGIFGAQKPKGILRTSIKGYSPTKEFYQPDYTNQERFKSNEPDLRSVVYWQPQINIENGKPAQVSYFNPDNTEEIIVIIEAITPEGGIGYHEITYPVKQKDIKDIPN